MRTARVLTAPGPFCLYIGLRAAVASAGTAGYFAATRVSCLRYCSARSTYSFEPM